MDTHLSTHSKLEKVPVILVGNKIDLRSGVVTNEALEDEIAPIMKEFKVCLAESFNELHLTDHDQEVETCLECSAMTQINVLEVIHFAQKAVTHPLAPLYDSHQHVWMPLVLNM